MNAVTPISIDHIATATANANRWIETARPIIRARFAIEDYAEHELSKARLADPTAFGPYSRMSPEARAWETAANLIRNCRSELFEMLDGIRGNFLCDEWPAQPDDDAPTSEWARRDEIMEEVDAAVLSVADAIKLVEREFWMRSKGL